MTKQGGGLIEPQIDGQLTEPKTLTSALVYRIHADIIACGLKPGERLRLGDLSGRYDAGVIPLREALSRLAAIGLVDVEDQKGFSVSSVSLADLEDITRTRVEIECIALRQAIELGDIDWESRVIAAHHRLSRLSQTRPENPHTLDSRWERFHRDLHVALLSGCASPWLMHFQGVLADQSTRYRRLAVAFRQYKRDVAGEHDRIVSAAIARDSKRACEFLAAHYQTTEDAVRSRASELFQGRDRGVSAGRAAQNKGAHRRVSRPSAVRRPTTDISPE